MMHRASSYTGTHDTLNEKREVERKREGIDVRGEQPHPRRFRKKEWTTSAHKTRLAQNLHTEIHTMLCPVGPFKRREHVVPLPTLSNRYPSSHAVQWVLFAHSVQRAPCCSAAQENRHDLLPSSEVRPQTNSKVEFAVHGSVYEVMKRFWWGREDGKAKGRMGQEGEVLGMARIDCPISLTDALIG